MGGEGCRVRRREGEGVITHMTRWGKRKKKNQERMRRGEGVETREVSGGNSVTGKCSNTACGAQLRGYTHTYTDIDVHTGRENTHIAYTQV